MRALFSLFVRAPRVSCGPAPCLHCGAPPVCSTRTLLLLYAAEQHALQERLAVLPPLALCSHDEREQVALRFAALASQLRALLARERGLCSVRCLDAAARGLS